jgi:hypothetical protein
MLKNIVNKIFMTTVDFFNEIQQQLFLLTGNRLKPLNRWRINWKVSTIKYFELVQITNI